MRALANPSLFGKAGFPSAGVEAEVVGPYVLWVVNREAKFSIGQVVQHRFLSFRGVIFDVDPTFDHSEEWWLAIPEKMRPAKDQPYYHLLAENEKTHYTAYVSEQNLLLDDTGEPVSHPDVSEVFGELADGCYEPLHIAH